MHYNIIAVPKFKRNCHLMFLSQSSFLTLLFRVFFPTSSSCWLLKIKALIIMSRSRIRSRSRSKKYSEQEQEQEQKQKIFGTLQDELVILPTHHPPFLCVPKGPLSWRGYETSTRLIFFLFFIYSSI